MIFGIPISDYAPATLLGITFLLVMFRKLVPEATYKDKEKESAKWEAAYKASEAAHALTRAQNAEMLEHTKVTRELLEAMFNTTEPPRRGGGAHRVVQTS